MVPVTLMALCVNVSPSYNMFKLHQRTEGLTTSLQGCATLSFQQA